MSMFHFKIYISINLNRFELKQIKNQEIAPSSNFVSPQHFFSQLLVFAQRPRIRSCSLLLHLILRFVLKSVHKTDSRLLSRTFSAASFLVCVVNNCWFFSFELSQCFAQVQILILLPNQLTVAKLLQVVLHLDRGRSQYLESKWSLLMREKMLSLSCQAQRKKRQP